MKNRAPAVLLALLPVLSVTSGCDQSANPMDPMADSDRIAFSGGLCGEGGLVEGEIEEEGGEGESSSGECVLDCVVTSDPWEELTTWMCHAPAPLLEAETSNVLIPHDEPACVDAPSPGTETRFYSPGATASFGDSTLGQAGAICEGGEWVPMAT